MTVHPELEPTADDGARHSPDPVWDESDRPLANATAPVRPTRRGLAAAQSLRDVHGQLRRELDSIRALVEQVADARLSVASARAVLNQMALRQQRWAVGASCSSYCTLVTQHHFGEDVEIFPALRAGTTGLDRVLDRLESEHVVIHALLDAVDAALISMVSDPSSAVELRTVVDRFGDALLSHLAYEERELLAPMALVFG